MLNHVRLLARRKFVWFIAAMAVLLAVCITRPSFMMWPHHIMLTWTGAPSTTQTITWHSGMYMQESKVEYAEVAENTQPVVKTGRSKQVETDGGVMTVHSIELTGLKPAVSYRYRVGNGFLWSSYHTFTTAPAQVEPFKFLLFGDSQGYSYHLWQETLRTAYAKNSDAAFIMNIGDLVDVGLNYSQWAEWFEAGQGVIDTIPELAVMGNHETYTTEWKIAQPLLYTAFFHLPDNGPDGLKGKVYSFDYGDAHFSILDSQLQEEAEWIPDMLKLQQDWLEKDLAASKKRWKLVFIHRPLYHNRPSESDQDLRDAFAPLFERCQVDAVFAGHDHVYARSYPLAGGVWSDEQGKGPVYFTIGRTGKKTFARAQPKDWDAVFYNPLDQPNYLTVEVSRQKLLVKAFKLNGDSVDVWSKRVKSN